MWLELTREEDCAELMPPHQDFRISLLNALITPFPLLNRRCVIWNAAELCLAENKDKKKLTLCVYASAASSIWTAASLLSAS